jgi:hypothetical protein
MEELIAAMMLEEEEDNDLLLHCMSDSATDIFEERKDELNFDRRVTYLMDSEMKFREFFGVSWDLRVLVCLLLDRRCNSM